MTEKLETEQNSDTNNLGKKASRAELLEKLRRLEEQHRDIEGMKRAASKDYNDQLKDIDAEITDVLALLKDTEVVPGA